MVEIEQKRYADDITTQELVRLRVENDQLRAALEPFAKLGEALQSGADAPDITDTDFARARLAFMKGTA